MDVLEFSGVPKDWIWQTDVEVNTQKTVNGPQDKKE